MGEGGGGGREEGEVRRVRGTHGYDLLACIVDMYTSAWFGVFAGSSKLIDFP